MSVRPVERLLAAVLGRSLTTTRSSVSGQRFVPLGVFVVALTLGSLVIVTTVPASAAVSDCIYDLATGRITVDQTNSGDSGTLRVDASGAIQYSDDAQTTFANCGANPTVTNTDGVDVLGGGTTFGIDIGTPFAPGVESEETGEGEIEFRVDARVATLQLIGGSDGDTITVGTDGASLNADDDVDVFMRDPTSTAIEIYGNDGADTLSGAGGSGTGDATAMGLSIEGGNGEDTITGGAGVDRLIGGADSDTLDGGAGTDRVYGGDGTDTCVLEGVNMGCDPSVRVTSTDVVPNGSLTVEGDGWYPENGDVELSVVPSGGVPSSTQILVTPDPTLWSIQKEIDAPSAGGTYSVRACHCRDADADRPVDSENFTVLSQTDGPPVASTRRLDLRPSEASPGDRIQVVGTGWDPDAGRVSIFFDPSPSTEPVRFAKPGSDEGFEVTLVVPDLGEGTYTMLACQLCNGDGRVQKKATLTIPGPSPSWWWFVLAPALLIAAIAGVAMHRVRARRLPPTGKPRAHLSADEPEVRVIAEPDGSPRHTVRLVTHADPGVQRLRERSPS